MAHFNVIPVSGYTHWKPMLYTHHRYLPSACKGQSNLPSALKVGRLLR